MEPWDTCSLLHPPTLGPWNLLWLAQAFLPLQQVSGNPLRDDGSEQGLWGILHSAEFPRLQAALADVYLASPENPFKMENICFGKL